MQLSPSIGSLSAAYSGNNSKQLTKSPSTVSLTKLWMVHVELISGHNLAIRDRSGVHACVYVYMSVRMCVHVRVYTYNAHVCVHRYMHVHVYTCMCIHAYDKLCDFQQGYLLL